MINISEDDAKLFEQNGFTKEQVGATINHYREQGLSDDDIQNRMNNKISEFKNMSAAPVEQVQEQPKGIDLTPSGIFKGSQDIIASAIAAPRTASKKGVSLVDAYKQNKDVVKQYRQKNPTPVQDFLVDTAAYSLIPQSKLAGVPGFISNVARYGTLPGTLEGLKNNNLLGGAAIGTGLGAGVQKFAPIILNKAGQTVEKIANNPNVQKGVARTLEVLTSVPEKYSKRALEKELQGQSILSKKFDADKAYRPIEKKLIEAKSKLPTNEGFADKFYNLGQKAKENLENIKNQAGYEIEQMLEGLNPEPINIGGLRQSINTVVNKMGKGGGNNPAQIRASKDLKLIKDMLGEEGTKVKPIDLHNAKEILYDMANYDTEGGIRNDVLKQAANQIKNFLRSKFPEYKAPNDKFAQIKKLEYELGGINSNTIGGKLSKYGDVSNIETGLDRRLKNINDILPKEQQFLEETKNLVSEQDKVNNINKLINSSYERNPRLLSNINDTAREEALQGLQDLSNIQFMDDLNNIRAQEALEKWFPGQGGGSGTEQGFGNLLRTSIIGGAPTAAAITHNPAALLGLGLVSPKFMAQGTIKNLARLGNSAEKIQNLSPLAQRLLTPIIARAGADMLRGGVQYNEQ